MKQNFFKTWFSGKSQGETLLEVIVALLVITMGAATATSLIITAINANVFNKDSLIALNLAQEGLEYMHNLRDSNWLAYSANTQHCWNMATSTGSCAPPYSGLLVEANPGTVPGLKKGYSLGAKLTTTANGTPLDLSNGVAGSGNDNEANYRIRYRDTDAAVNSDGVGTTTDDNDFMASSPNGTTNGLPWTMLAFTKYYRSIEIQYNIIAPSAPWGLTPTTDPKLADMMIVTSRVQWLDGPNMREVALSSALSSYK
jgi:hypothetical protein